MLRPIESLRCLPDANVSKPPGQHPPHPRSFRSCDTRCRKAVVEVLRTRRHVSLGMQQPRQYYRSFKERGKFVADENGTCLISVRCSALYHSNGLNVFTPVFSKSRVLRVATIKSC